MRCGREPGGNQVRYLGICPASIDVSYDGLNNGENAGRLCWAVAGTFCGGEIQGTFAEKRQNCLKCSFFKLVRDEEDKTETPTKFLSYIETHAKGSFLNQLTYRYIKAGERFVTQGEPGDQAFIIHSGTCLTIVEKKGDFFPVHHRGKGDIVGIRSLLTGEPRSAHVEAETDMKLWVLNKAQFRNLSRSDPELISFLTEIVNSLFDSNRPIADRVIGKYVINRIIGRGSHSIVYIGEHSILKMPVAIKMMRHNMVVDSDFLNCFRQEGRIVAGLNHENIVRVYDIEERFQTLFLVMEYLEGESLSDLLKRLKKIPLVLAIDFLHQLCSGLSYAHKQGIIHRDINTVNIFVQDNDRIKILDFGLACPAGTDDLFVGGALQYQAPELFEGLPADIRSDIYSLGITAYEIITGNMPYTKESINKFIQCSSGYEIPDPKESIANIPDGLRNFIFKCCKRNPDERYQSVDDALNDLTPLIKHSISKLKERISRAQRKTTILFVRLNEDQQQEFAILLENFKKRLKEENIELKIAKLDDS